MNEELIIETKNLNKTYKGVHAVKNLNLKVKYRESFRPFAPSVLREDVDDWFEHDVDSPYMLMVA